MRVLRFQDHKTRGIFQNRMAQKRAIEKLGFPPGFDLADNTHVFDEDEVLAWLKARRDLSECAAPAPREAFPTEAAYAVYQRAMKLGRERKSHRVHAAAQPGAASTPVRQSPAPG